jgi:hypothetical protein
MKGKGKNRENREKEHIEQKKRPHLSRSAHSAPKKRKKNTDNKKKVALEFTNHV